jgi:hypothetical protein
MTRLMRVQTYGKHEAYIPVESIGRIQRDWEGKGKGWSRAMVYDREGGEIGVLGDSELNRILQPEGVFPSLPGWYVVQSVCVHEDGADKTEVSRTPIVGWCYRGFDITPITPDDVLNAEFFELTASANLLQSPDGSYITSEGITVTFINDDEILKWIRDFG